MTSFFHLVVAVADLKRRFDKTQPRLGRAKRAARMRAQSGQVRRRWTSSAGEQLHRSWQIYGRQAGSHEREEKRFALLLARAPDFLKVRIREFESGGDFQKASRVFFAGPGQLFLG